MRAIRRNLLRSFLTVLGIVIGVAAVITMVRDQIAGLGSNLLQLRPGQRLGPGFGGGGAPAFQEDDLEAIATRIGGLAAVAPEVRSGSTVVANGKNWQTTVIGSTEAYFIAGNWPLVSGRAFSNAELKTGAAVCLIGATVQRELFGAGVDTVSACGSRAFPATSLVRWEPRAGRDGRRSGRRGDRAVGARRCDASRDRRASTPSSCR